MDTITEEEAKELSELLNYEFYVDQDGALCAEDDRHRISVELMYPYINWLFMSLKRKGLYPINLNFIRKINLYR